MRRAALALAAVLPAACAAAAFSRRSVDEARTRDADALATRADDVDGPACAGQFVVVQDGELAAVASLADDAVRAAVRKDAKTPHRFVFRPGDRGPRIWRMTYLAEGGVAVGRKFLADLGLEAVGGGARPSIVRKRGASGGVDLRAAPRLSIEITTLDGAARRVVDAVFDPDFDGGLLLPVDVATALSLERFEIPGDAEVQVAVGRPFRARRALVLARVAALDASAAAEAVYENASAAK